MARTSKSHSNAIKRCAKSRSAENSATRNKKSKKSTTKKVVKTSVKASATRSATKKGTPKVTAATKSATKKKTTKAGKKTAVVVPLSLDDVKMKKSLGSESEKPKGVAETIAKRLSKKQADEKGGVKRPRMRRGRRPKNLADYTPTHGDDESESADTDFQGLQYDTGISVSKRSDDIYSFERFEDSEEELNFDS